MVALVTMECYIREAEERLFAEALQQRLLLGEKLYREEEEWLCTELRRQRWLREMKLRQEQRQRQRVQQPSIDRQLLLLPPLLLPPLLLLLLVLLLPPPEQQQQLESMRRELEYATRALGNVEQYAGKGRHLLKRCSPPVQTSWLANIAEGLTHSVQFSRPCI